MNRPSDKIHDTLSGSGYLLLPTFKKDIYGARKWLARFKMYGIRQTDCNGFHNITEKMRKIK